MQPHDDQALVSHIQETLKKHPEFERLDFSVTSNDGVVMLKGPVESKEHRQKALRVVRSIKGVRSVTDELQEKSGQSVGNRNAAGSSSAAGLVRRPASSSAKGRPASRAAAAEAEARQEQRPLVITRRANKNGKRSNQKEMR